MMPAAFLLTDLQNILYFNVTVSFILIEAQRTRLLPHRRPGSRGEERGCCRGEKEVPADFFTRAVGEYPPDCRRVAERCQRIDICEYIGIYISAR